MPLSSPNLALSAVSAQLAQCVAQLATVAVGRILLHRFVDDRLQIDWDSGHEFPGFGLR
jgi:hypothetical protein